MKHCLRVKDTNGQSVVLNLDRMDMFREITKEDSEHNEGCSLVSMSGGDKLILDAKSTERILNLIKQYCSLDNY